MNFMWQKEACSVNSRKWPNHGAVNQDAVYFLVHVRAVLLTPVSLDYSGEFVSDAWLYSGYIPF